VTVTSTPDNAFPFSSTKLPLISEVVVTAKAEDEKIKKTDNDNCFNLFIVDIPSKVF
jgi:hypothetical protein